LGKEKVQEKEKLFLGKVRGPKEKGKFTVKGEVFSKKGGAA